MPSSSHLQDRYKSPDPALNLHCCNKADITEQISSVIPASNGGETPAYIFIGQGLKITNIYKSADNSCKEFLSLFQDCIRTRGVPTMSIADNTSMYRGWKVTKYIRVVIASLWQYET